MDEVEEVARAIRRHHVTRTRYYGSGKAKARRLHSGDLEAAQAAIAVLDKARGDPVAIRNAALEEAANAAYVACAETRHVSLGDKCAAAIRALKDHP